MNWDDARKACAALGDCWRLPNKSELLTLYKFKDKLGGFPDNYYWSSSECGYNNVWFQDFANGAQWETGLKRDLLAVRAVNNPDTSVVVYDLPWERKYLSPNKSKLVYLTDNYYFDKIDRELKVKTAGVVDDDLFKSQIIGKPVKIGNLLVAEKKFPEEMNWDDANKACTLLGNGWRLPTQEELNILYQNKDEIGGFSNKNFWSSTVYSDNNLGWQSFGDGRASRTKKEAKYVNVRAVKTNSAEAAQLEKQYKTIDLNDNNFDKTDKGKKVEAASELQPNIVNALKKLNNKIDRDYLLKILDKPDPENKNGDICGTTTTGCYWCNKEVQISKFYKSRGNQLLNTLIISNFGMELDLKRKIEEIRKNGFYYCEANLTWNMYFCSRNCEYLYKKSKN